MVSNGSNRYDIIIVGGGLCGTALAALLPNTWRIAILERQLPDALISYVSQQASQQGSSISAQGQDQRPLSLSYSSYIILKEQFMLWDELASLATAIMTVHVSEMGRFGVTRLTAKTAGVPVLGYVIPMFRLRACLYLAVAKKTNVDIICSSDIIEIVNQSSEVSVKFVHAGQTKTLVARLLVGADGSDSTVRRCLKLPVTTQSEINQARTATLTLAHPHHGVAYERFTPEGTLALLPLGGEMGRTMRLVWTMSPAIAKRYSDENDVNTISTIQRYFRGRIKITDYVYCGIYPVKQSIANQQVCPSVVLIGNAAQTLYPIVAQGFNLGLRDVVTLHTVLTESDSMQWDLSVLQNYEQRRAQDQNRIGHFTSLVYRTFNQHGLGLGCWRGLGLMLLDLSPRLQQRLTSGLFGPPAGVWSPKRTKWV